MKQDNDGLEINIDSESKDSNINGLINAFKKLDSIVNKTVATFKKFTTSMTPTSKKIDDIAKKSEDAGKKISESLNVKPSVDTSEYTSQLKQLEDREKELLKYINQIQEGTKKGIGASGTIWDASKKESVRFGESGKLERELKDIRSKMSDIKLKINTDDAENSLKKVDNNFKNFINEYINKKPKLHIDVQDALRNIKSLEQAEDVLNKIKSGNVVGDTASTRTRLIELAAILNDIIKQKQELNTQNNGLAKPLNDADSSAKRLKEDLSGNGIDTIKKKFGLFGTSVGRIFKNSRASATKFFGIFPSMGKKVSNTTDSLYNKFKKLGLGLIGVRTAMSVLTKAVGAYLSFDGVLSDSITNSWNMLGSLLAPAIELVAHLFAIATNYVYNFVKALTGIDLVARANAKSLKTQAAATKAAGQAQRSLSSMDEITNLQTDSGSKGADIPQIKTMDIDTSWIDTIAEEVKKIAETLFEPIRKAWDKVGSQVISSAKKALSSMWELIKAIGRSFVEVWTNGTGERIMTNIFLILRNIFDIIGNIADRWREAWESGNTGTNIIQNLANALNDVLELIEHVTLAIADWWKTDDASLFSESILNIFETLSGWVEYITDKLVELWDNGLKKIMDGVNSLGTGVVALLDPILKDLDPIVKLVIDIAEKIGEIVASTIGDVLQSIGDALQWIAGNEIAVSIIEGLGLAIAGAVVAMNAWNIAMGIFSAVMGVATTVGSAFAAVIGFITSPITLIVIGVGLLIGLIILLVKHFDEVKVAVGAAIEGIKGFFEGVLDFFKGIIQWFADLVDTVFSFFKDNWQGILLFIINPFAGAFKLLYDNFEGFRNFVDGIVSGIADFFSNLWNGITTGASKAWEGVKTAFNSIKSFFTGIINTIMGMFKTIGTSVGNVVAGAFKGVVNGILKAIENILNTPIKAINGLIKIINKVPGINLGKLNTFNLPRLATGTNNIEKEGIYHLHEGEAVVPKKYNPATGGYDNGADNRQIIDLLIDLNANMLALSEREMAVYMDSRKVAEGIYDDIQTVTKNKNMSSVMKRS